MAMYATKCTYDNIKFDSETERDYYIKLKLLKEEGNIKDFEMQVPYLLQDEFINFRDKLVPQCGALLYCPEGFIGRNCPLRTSGKVLTKKQLQDKL